MDSTSLPIKLQSSNLRPVAYRVLSKKHGLNIKTDALKLLTELVSYKFGFDWKGQKCLQYLEDIAKAWKSQDRGIFIDADGLRQVSKELKTQDDVPEVAGRRSTFVDQANIEEAIEWEEYFKIINPHEQMNFRFDRIRKQFSLIQDSHKLSACLKSSTEYFSNRYYLIVDRLSRNENFQKSSFSSISSINNSLNKTSMTNEITLIKNVLGRDGSKFILFGLLSKNSNDDFVLEDATDYIELNLTQAFKTEGSYYCPGMFVIVEGIYSASGGTSLSTNYMGGCFHVSNITHPPAEKRDIAMENYGHLDFLGIHQESKSKALASNQILKIDRQLKKKLATLEKSLSNHRIIVLGSDCFLDDFKVLDGLKKLFLKLENEIIENEEFKPLAIIMIGSFISAPLTPSNSSTTSITNSESYKSHFDKFATILSTYEYLIKNTKFVLIPGKNDPWQSTYSMGSLKLDVFPQRNIPKVFTNRLERLLPKGNLILGWNPLRINYLSQELVVIKDDFTSKFKRNDIVFDTDIEMENERLAKEKEGLRVENINTDEIHLSSKIKQARKLVKTLLDQGSLQPFMKNLKVIDPKYDYALRIEPLPNVIIINDANFENFEVTYNSCKVVNISKLTGSNRKLNYVEYYPSNKKFYFKEIYF